MKFLRIKKDLHYNKFLFIATAFITLVALFPYLISSTPVIEADDQTTLSPEEELKQIEQQLREIQNQRDGIQSQIDQNSYLIDGYNAQASQLMGEMQIFQKDIDSLELQIKEIEVSIKALEETITKKEEEIRVSEDNMAEMEKESEKRIEDSYKNFRVYGHDLGSGSNILNIDKVNQYFKDVKYRDIIQSNANITIRQLIDLRHELGIKKAELEANLVQVKKDKEAIEAKRIDLDRRKSELDVKWAAYQNAINDISNRSEENRKMLVVISQDQAEKQAQAERIKIELFNNFTPPDSGEYVTSGRPIGIQGCTGLCTGPHLHFSVQENGAWQDPCGYLPGGVVAGCGWGSRLSWPIGSAVFTSPFGDRCFDWGGTYCDFHTGADFAGSANSPIYSAHDGWLYYGWDPYGAHYAVICEVQNCSSGIKTGYWHMQ